MQSAIASHQYPRYSCYAVAKYCLILMAAGRMLANCAGAKRANIAVALAEADRARIVQANNDRIAGTSPAEVPTAGLVKAIYLRAQCLVINQ
jgi:hypothetical protein